MFSRLKTKFLPIDGIFYWLYQSDLPYDQPTTMTDIFGIYSNRRLMYIRESLSKDRWQLSL